MKHQFWSGFLRKIESISLQATSNQPRQRYVNAPSEGLVHATNKKVDWHGYHFTVVAQSSIALISDADEFPVMNRKAGVCQTHAFDE